MVKKKFGSSTFTASLRALPYRDGYQWIKHLSQSGRKGHPLSNAFIL